MEEMADISFVVDDTIYEKNDIVNADTVRYR